MTTKLTGAFIQIYKVDGFGGVEVENLVASTKDDVTIPWEVQEASTSEHDSKRLTKQATVGAPTLNFGGLLVSDMAALTTLGLLVSGKVEPYGTPDLDIRIKVYATKGAASPALKVACRKVTVKLGDLSFPGAGYCQWTGSAIINGDVIKE